MNKKIFIDNIKAANKEIPCDLVVKNISVVDVFQCSSFICDVAIKNGFIVGLGDYSGDIEIDGTILKGEDLAMLSSLIGISSLSPSFSLSSSFGSLSSFCKDN